MYKRKKGMLNESLQRCIHMHQIKDVKSLKRDQDMYLYCYKGDCENCTSFAEKRKTFEKDMPIVWDWDCSYSTQNDAALDAGVSRIPAYIKVCTQGIVTVQYP